MPTADLNGVIDLHVHAGPDVRPRKMDAVALALAAKAAGMRAVLLKSHHTITADLAQIVEEVVGGIRIFGGVTLDEAGRVRDEVRRILDLVAQADVILGTCHLSPEEILILVRTARQAGVRKVLVSHPELHGLAIPLAMQQEMASEGAFFERMHVHGNSVTDWSRLAEIMRAVGIERTVLVTDLGRADYAVDPIQGMGEFLDRLADQGFSQAEIDLMARRTPARLLGLDPW